MIRSFFFSPSGTTKKVAEFLSKVDYAEVKSYDVTEALIIYWQEEQLDLIEKIGVQNWLMTKAI